MNISSLQEHRWKKQKLVLGDFPLAESQRLGLFVQMEEIEDNLIEDLQGSEILDPSLYLDEINIEPVLEKISSHLFIINTVMIDLIILLAKEYKVQGKTPSLEADELHRLLENNQNKFMTPDLRLELVLLADNLIDSYFYAKDHKQERIKKELEEYTTSLWQDYQSVASLLQLDRKYAFSSVFKVLAENIATGKMIKEIKKEEEKS